MSNDPMSSAAATPASPSVTPVSGEERTIPDTYGHTWHDAFAYYDPTGCCWRTSQGTLALGLEPSSVIWPPSGTMQNGRCYQRRPLVPRISDGDCSLWPTPRVSATRTSRGALRPEDHNHWSDLSLEQAVEVADGILPRELDTAEELPPRWRAMWPTPRVANARQARLESHHVAATPGQLNPTWVEWLMGFPTGWTDLDA